MLSEEKNETQSVFEMDYLHAFLSWYYFGMSWSSSCCNSDLFFRKVFDKSLSSPDLRFKWIALPELNLTSFFVMLSQELGAGLNG